MASTTKKFSNVNLNAPKTAKKTTIFETVVTSAKPALTSAAAPARIACFVCGTLFYLLVFFSSACRCT